MGFIETLRTYCNESLGQAVRDDFDCVQATILPIVPCIFFFLFFPIFCAQIYRIRVNGGVLSQQLPWTVLLIIKTTVTIFLLLVILAKLVIIIYRATRNVYIPAIDFIYTVIIALTTFGLLCCILLARKNGMVSSGILHISWILFALCGFPEYFTTWQRLPAESIDGINTARLILYQVWYPFAVIQAIAFCFADRRRQFLVEASKKLNRSPELDSSFLNRLTLWWFTAIPLLGARKTLVDDDLYQLNEGNTAVYLSTKWDELWNPAVEEYRERRTIYENTLQNANSDTLSKNTVESSPGKLPKTKSKKDNEPKPPSVVWRLFLMFRFEILSATGIKICSDTLQFASPFFLNLVLNYISGGNPNLLKGIAFAFGMFACAEVRSFLLNYYFYLMMRTLRLSNSARKGRTVGEIVNLMAIDVERFQVITPQIQQFWSCPYQITLALIYLFFTIGASAACGVGVMILFLPLNIITSIIVKKWQAEQMRLKDERAKICNEILNGIKVIKLYAWEPPMEETVEQIRQKELDLVRKAGLTRAVIDGFNTSSPFFVALLTFATYTLSSSSHVLTPQIAFVSLTLFNQLRSPMTMIAYLINMTVQALVANKRIKSFLVADELNPLSIDRGDDQSDSSDAIEIKKARLSWDVKDPNTAVSDIDSFIVPKKTLIAVVGKVGSGKSTLLSAISGEMEKLKGYIGVRGQVAAVGQQPWIQNLSLRDNVTFGKKFDQKYYDKIIEACALVKDLAILPNGDATEIGEKGINLSGGQKARVALARAVYQNCDIYLLDDPLSAVDSHVGKHIFEKVIGPSGLLRRKTRVLVTNSLACLVEVDNVAYVQDGKLAAFGPYEKLMEESESFAKFIDECRAESEKEEESKKESETGDSGVPEEDSSQAVDYEEDDENDEGIYEESYLKSEFDRHMSTLSSLARGSSCSFHRPSKTRSSSQSPTSELLSDKKNEKAAKLIESEKAETGRVKFSVYIQYVRSATVLTSFLFVFLFGSYAALQMGRGLWLSAWSNANDAELSGSKTKQLSLGTRLGVYAAFGFAEGISFFLALMFLVLSGLRASMNLHTPLLHNLLRSPMSFFDTTPIGRILNRLGKDIDVIDQLLPINFRYFVYCLQNVAATLIIIVISTPIFAAVIVPLSFIYYISLHFYVPTSRQLKRLESINRSPIYQHFAETIQGVACIRVFGKVQEFCKSSEVHVDRFTRCKYFNILSNRWLAVRLEFVGNCVVLFAALFAVLSQRWGTAISAGIAGLSVTYALNITETLNFAVRQVSELETNIVAVERVKEYAETPTEAKWKVDDFKPEEGWPSEGQITLRDYSTRYRPGLDLVVRQLNAFIAPAEKIGIVGRTGAGKSSLALALFRIVEPVEGTILIDGVDITLIGLHDLRSNLTIIPQDPVLFSGTLRFNLDPFQTYSDQDVWVALELAHLKAFASGLAEGLQHRISEGGENVSVGQRQLICLARALLRKSKVLVLDEATAAVDLATDSLIQGTIRHEFRNSTVLTIAHRLNTILDYDRVLVLDNGSIIEFDSPQNLLANRTSIFFAMASDAQIVS